MKGGNDANYLTAKIARDRPDILDRMKAGEFTSVRKAALEAGFIPPTVTIPIVPWRAARLLRKHFTGALWPALMDAIEATSTPDAGEEVS